MCIIHIGNMLSERCQWVYLSICQAVSVNQKTAAVIKFTDSHEVMLPKVTNYVFSKRGQKCKWLHKFSRYTFEIEKSIEFLEFSRSIANSSKSGTVEQWSEQMGLIGSRQILMIALCTNTSGKIEVFSYLLFFKAIAVIRLQITLLFGF